MSINISKGIQKIHLEFAPRQRLCGNHSVEPEAEREILHLTCFEKRSIIFQSNNVSHHGSPEHIPTTEMERVGDVYLAKDAQKKKNIYICVL